MKTETTPKRATVAQTSERELTIERTFDAPRERVWRALTDPKWVAAWWGRGNPLTVERLEVVRGGHWRYVEHTEHGDHGFEGRFREVQPPSRISMTFEWDGAPGHVVVETMTLHDLGDGRTKLVTVASYHAAEDLAAMRSSGMEEGMNQSYEALDRVLASM